MLIRQEGEPSIFIVELRLSYTFLIFSIILFLSVRQRAIAEMLFKSF